MMPLIFKTWISLYYGCQKATAYGQSSIHVPNMVSIDN